MRMAKWTSPVAERKIRGFLYRVSPEDNEDIKQIAPALTNLTTAEIKGFVRWFFGGDEPPPDKIIVKACNRLDEVEREGR